MYIYVLTRLLVIINFIDSYNYIDCVKFRFYIIWINNYFACKWNINEKVLACVEWQNVAT